MLSSAFESLYGGQFTLSTQLIKPNYNAKSIAKTSCGVKGAVSPNLVLLKNSMNVSVLI